MKFKKLIALGLTSLMVLSSLNIALAAETPDPSEPTAETAEEETTPSETNDTLSDESSEMEYFFLNADDYYEFKNAGRVVSNSRALSETAPKYYSILDSTPKTIYDCINKNADYSKVEYNESLKCYAQQITYGDCSSLGMTRSNYEEIVSEAYYAFSYDNPLCSWAYNFAIGYNYNTETGSITYLVVYLITCSPANDIAGYMTKYNDWKDAVINGAREYTEITNQIKYIHDEICKKTTYGYVGDYSSIYDPNYLLSHSIFGIPVNSYAVCEGYAKTFKAICDELGICCIYQTGDPKEGSIGHAWNIVQMDDNKWYYLDITWDDKDDNNNPYDYKNFLMGETYFSGSPHNQYTYLNSLSLNIPDTNYANATSLRTPTVFSAATTGSKSLTGYSDGPIYVIFSISKDDAEKSSSFNIVIGNGDAVEYKEGNDVVNDTVYEGVDFEGDGEAEYVSGDTNYIVAFLLENNSESDLETVFYDLSLKLNPITDTTE